MPLTVADYKARMKQAIGNAEPSTGITLIDVLNEALRHVFSFSDWKWRERPVTSCNFVNGQSYVSLPADFGTGGELLSVHSVWSPTAFIEKVSLSDIARYRGLPIQNLLKFYVAISTPSQTNPGSSGGNPILEIWPTPGSSVTGAFRITYRAGYVLLASDSQVPNIPIELERALTLTARGMTMLYEMGGTAGDAVQEMNMANAELERMVEADGLTEQDAGAITGGAAAPYANSGVPPLRPFASWPGHQ